MSPNTCQACDSCRIRRIRCGNRNPSPSASGLRTWETQSTTLSPQNLACQNCSEAGIPCTYDIPLRTRGRRPKQAATPDQIAEPSSYSTWRLSPPSLPPDSVIPEEDQQSTEDNDSTAKSSDVLFSGRTAASDLESTDYQWSDLQAPIPPFSIVDVTMFHQLDRPPGPAFSTDRICQRAIFDIIIQDWMDLIYLLIPILHRPTFRNDLAARREESDPVFFSFLASMCAAVVGMVPSLFLKYSDLDISFPFRDRTQMIDFCHELVMGSRRSDYFDTSTQEKWGISYLLAVAHGNRGLLNRSLSLAAEARHHIQQLDCRHSSSYQYLTATERELRKISFWLSSCGFFQVSLLDSDTQHHHRSQSAWFEGLDLEYLLPLEVEDESSPEGANFRPNGLEKSVTSGLNTLVRLYLLALPGSPSSISEIEPKSDYSTSTQPTQGNTSPQLTELKWRFQRLKYALDDTCSEFREWTTDIEDDPFANNDQHSRSSMDRQFGIMKANILVSHLWLQSVILEEIISLHTFEKLQLAGTEERENQLQNLWNEREDISRQLLHILHIYPHATLEANGISLVYKVRAVASTLLDCPYKHKKAVFQRTNFYIDAFTRILSIIDKNLHEPAMERT